MLCFLNSDVSLDSILSLASKTVLDQFMIKEMSSVPEDSTLHSPAAFITCFGSSGKMLSNKTYSV